jgi:hypothetical protein
MVLGPLLTLIVFRPGKPGLKYDLALIALVQTAALSWGVWTVYDQRTAMVTFAADTFITMNSEMVDQAGEKPRAMLAQARVGTGPVYAVIALPDNRADRRAMLNRLNSKPLHMQGEAYQPLEKSDLKKILEQSIDVKLLASKNPEAQIKLDAFLKKTGGNIEDYAFLPLLCRYTDLTIVLRRADGAIAGSLDIHAFGVTLRR